jgi:hypothetical protein
MLITRKDIAESVLGERFWFKAATTGIDASNVTFKALVGTTQHHLMYGWKKDVSEFQAFEF